MLSQKLSLRRATPDDATLIATLGARTFKASFGADNRQVDMQQYLSFSFSKTNIEAQLSDPSSIYFLAYEDSKAIGYLMLRVNKKPTCVKGTKPVELVRLYVEEELIGKGYGSALMNSCLEEVKTNGHRTIWLGVWEKNHRAIRFYEKWGFTKVGTKEFVLGSDLQNDHIMARSLEVRS
jgi:ribosomal protein S18 acetylase RimI-like enzyme